jgi:hypothetical protein
MRGSPERVFTVTSGGPPDAGGLFMATSGGPPDATGLAPAGRWLIAESR